MDTNFMELFMLYDINSISKPLHMKDFFDHALEKATRLFGVTKMGIVIQEEDFPCYTWKWGFNDDLEILDSYKEKSKNSFIHIIEGLSGFIYFEQINDISSRERRLYHIFSSNIEIAIKKYLGEKKLVLEQKEKETILNSLTEKLVYLDLQKRIVWANQKAVESVGVSMQQLKGKPCYSAMGQCGKGCIECPVDSARITGLMKESTVSTSCGRVLHIRAYPVQSAENVVEGIVETIYDITEQVRANEAVEESEKKYKNVLEIMHECYFEIDMNMKIVESNSAANNMIGYDPQKLKGTSFCEICLEKSKMEKALKSVIESGTPTRGFITRLKHSTKGDIYTELSFIPLKSKAGEVYGVSMFAWDITERIKYEETLRYLSLNDHLTGLYNRAYMDDYITQNKVAYPVTVISVDLDGLKLINDTMGHASGDKLIKSCADILKRSVGEGEIVVRLGGDEFCIVLQNTDGEKGEGVAALIRHYVDEYNLANPSLHLSLSMGLATSNQEDQNIYDILKKSDNLMYHDKLYRSNSVKSEIVNTLMVTLAERDGITHGHAERLQNLCIQIAEKIELPTENRSNLALLSKVHDLGKVGVPDHILLKNGPLTDEEWNEMRQHSEKGYRIACSSPELLHVSKLILFHHERWDGRGYPFGLKEKAIPVECRILSIVDAFDAMTNDRQYRKAISDEEAINEIINCRGTQFDPELVDAFLAVINK